MRGPAGSSDRDQIGATGAGAAARFSDESKVMVLPVSFFGRLEAARSKSKWSGMQGRYD